MKRICQTDEIFSIANARNELAVDSIVQTYSTKDWIPFGKNNLFPNEAAKLSREAVNHRAILNSKVQFIEGKKITTESERLENFIETNKLKSVFHNLLLDRFITGNCYFEIVVDRSKNLLKVFHQDATKARLSRDLKVVIIQNDWVRPKQENEKRIGLYPNFTKGDDGFLHSIVHIKDYEPEFNYYGVPQWYAGWNSAQIGKKTTEWNKNKLENNFSISGLLIVPGITDVKDAEKFESKLKKYKGSEEAGKIMPHYLRSQGVGEQREEAKFIPFNENNNGSWIDLHRQSDEDLIKSHGWYKSLCAFSENTGFDTQRIINDYKLAKAIVIDPEQEKFKTVFNYLFEYFGLGEIDIVNASPVVVSDPLMYVWEYRKMQGWDFDETKPEQKVLIANVGGVIYG